MATILRAYNDNQEKYDLDLYNEESFRLDISAIESGEIGTVFGISSQKFSLPGTDNNQQYFGNLDNIGASPASSFIKTLPCQVLVDGQEIFNGKIYLESVVTDQRGDTVYNAIVVNEIVDFKYQVLDKTFGDLDWSEYDHELTYTNISSSWDLDLFSGDIVYPLAEYGVEDNDPDAVQLVNGGGLNSFTNETTPLKPIDFKPAIRLKAVVDKIFENTDYTYSSSFLDSANVSNIYVLATQDESRTAGSFVSPVSQSFSAYPTASQQFTPPSFTWNKVSFSAETYDNGNRWDTGTSEFTAGATGNYSFAAVLPLTISNLNSFTARNIVLAIYKNGVRIQGTERFYNYTGLGTLPPIVTYSTIISANWNNLELTAGDIVELYVQFTGPNASEILEFYAATPQTYFQMYQGPSSYQGSTVSMGKLFPSDQKVTDFLAGVIQKFNLVLEPRRDEQNVIGIETFDVWKDNGVQKDWTDKVDRSVKFEISHPLQDNPKKLYFSDEPDEDYFNKYSQDFRKKTFGELEYFSDSDLATGERSVGTYFSPTPMKSIEGANNFIVPQIYAADGPGSIKTRLVFNPRLLYYLGKKESNQLLDFSGIFNLGGAGTITQGVWWMSDELDTPYSQSYYPVFHHVNELPATSTSLDLHFGNLNHVEYHQQFKNAQTPKDAFYTYWAEYVNELYDIDSRLVTVNIALKPTDIPTIKLNDKIFVDGHYYRINKIQGANLTKEESVKVELLKVPTRKLKYPRRRIFDIGIGVGYSDVTVSSVDANGRVVYEDYETGATITDPALLQNASSRDGFRYFPGDNEVVWVQDRQSVPSNNTVRGVNYVDERAINVRVEGNGNTVGPYVRNSSIVGSGNTLMDVGGKVNIFGDNVSAEGVIDNLYVVNLTGSAIIESGSNNVIAFNPTKPITPLDAGRTILGTTVTQGQQYETYVNVEVGPGTITYLTGSAGTTEDFHHHFNYTGANGTATVYMPSASLAINDGLQMRFTTNATLNASKVVNLIPSDGTIDGGAEKALTEAYDGITAQVLNGEWLVIQAKG